ncbi:hypothetical protein [Pseudomonas chlororaphis]|uniref:hypothetical protein n=1 Tax=Pseudomonas chlororaphis TaxID=587753 RepID=UPI00046FB8E8|nr:hypothetical protein [Pseudomonas chlororaphis]
MAANKFKLPLLQAVSDWQRSSTPKRSAELKEQCASLPDKFRTGVKRCYRQVGLTKGFVWDLIADECLKEKVSSWTLSLPVAMTFKNGVPPQGGGYQGVIVMTERPASERIIVNINRLYKDHDFLAAMEANKASITGYTEGAGRYKGSQQEIVIEMDTVSKSQIRSLGGHSSDLNELTQLAHISIYFQFGRLATPQELAHAATLVGPSWLSQAATRRVLERVDVYTEVLREVKRLQAQAGMAV